MEGAILDLPRSEESTKGHWAERREEKDIRYLWVEKVKEGDVTVMQKSIIIMIMTEMLQA